MILKIEKGNPWVYGVLVNNVWSVSSSGSSGSYSNFLMQPFLNYNFPGGTYLTSAPIVTANWQASGDKWTVPAGGRCRSYLSPRPAAGEHTALRVLQRRENGRRRDMAAPLPGAVPVPEVIGCSAENLRINRLVRPPPASTRLRADYPRSFSRNSAGVIPDQRLKARLKALGSE